jgi:hypothetical protein
MRNCYWVTAVVYLLTSRSLPSNESTCHIALSLEILIQNSLQACHHYFFSEGYTCDVCDRPSLSSPWLGSHGDYSSTAPSLKPLVPRGSLKSCELVKVYHHYPRYRVRLDPVWHIIYGGDYLIWALPGKIELGRFPLCAGWTIESHFVAILVVSVVGQSVVTTFHPVIGQLQVLAGIITDVV